ncbi:MAG: CvpA family protein [Actinobacteria bacterium]|nr:CvpA family protein [Actinomycetota bacterium]
MLDFIIGLILAALLVRGWLRGFVREILDLVGLVAGLWIAFKLSAPFGDFLTRSFGVTPEVARIGAGIALFVLFGVSLSVAAHYLSKVMSLPGLNMVNRVGGAAVAVAWGVALVLVVVNVVRVLPIPDQWETQLEESSVVEAIAGPGAPPQQLFDSLAGDNVLGALASIQAIFGTSRAVPAEGQELSIPPAAPDEVRQVRDEADEIVEEINRFRTGLGLRPLLQSDGIDEVAEQKAASMYISGRLFRGTNCSRDLTEAGVRTVFCGEVVALAGTSLGALDGILDSGSGHDELADPAYDRSGVSVVDGTTGRLLVVVLGG